MKDALARIAGSKLPVKVTRTNGQEVICYIPGFADQQTNIILIGKTSFSQALNILEVKDIRKLEYAENGSGDWRVLYAKWMCKPERPMLRYLGLIGLLGLLT